MTETGAAGAPQPPQPPPTPQMPAPVERWPLISLLPCGLGAWAPIVGGVRRRERLWVWLGIFWTAVAAGGLCAAATHAHSGSASHRTAISPLLLGIAWLGGAVTSFSIVRGSPPPAPATTASQISFAYAARNRLRASPWPPPTARSRRWTVRFGLAAYVLTFLGANAVGLVLRAAGAHVPIGLGAMIVDAFLLAALIPLHRRYGLSPSDLGLRRVHGARSVGIAIVALLSYGSVTAIWVVAVHPSAPAHELIGAGEISDIERIVDTFALAVSAPFAEEVFFRGILYRTLRNSLPVWSAALIAGCLFGLVHATSYPFWTLPVKAAFGVIACLMYERTGSLLPGIAVHSFVDASAADVAFWGNDFAVLGVYGGLAIVILARSGVRRLRSGPAGTVAV